MIHNRFKISAGARLCCAGLGIVFLTGHNGVAAEAKKKPVEIKIRTIDSAAAAKVSFSRDIKPILINTCTECHSAEDRKSDFEVTTVETLKQKGKKAGVGIIPGKPDESSVVKYIRGLADGPQMPKGLPPLSEEELHLIRSWIAVGAKDDSAEPANVSAQNEKGSFGNLNPDAQKLLNRLLYDNFSASERFVATRQFRTTFLPPAPRIPETSVADDGRRQIPEPSKDDTLGNAGGRDRAQRCHSGKSEIEHAGSSRARRRVIRLHRSR